MVSGPIERPIENPTQDRLDRGRFVERLRDALINRRSGRSTSVVLGIVGPWGSGKSSVLNLLRMSVKASYPGAVVVSFDPWLISGRNDLVTEFLAELLTALKAEPQAAKAFRKVISALAKYGAMLAPAASLMAPHIGEAGKAGFEAISAMLERDGSLQSMRAEILRELSKAELPILVLIDEIDRIEDAEIRAIAQLVRSVMDFPGISYVLSYDAERVIQALGAGGDPARQAERGRAYLEKIVQLEIPLPLTFTTELRGLLIEGLESLSDDFSFLQNINGLERLDETIAAMQRGLIKTPRDVKRLIGAFQVMAYMVADEIDWIDVLGFCALICRFPRLIELIRRSPDMYISDSLSLEENLRRKRSFEEKTLDLDNFAPINGDYALAREMLCQLFPRLAGYHRRSAHPNALSTRRALLTILRLGDLPPSETRPDLSAAFSENPEKVRATLQNIASTGELAPYLQLLLEHETIPAGIRFTSFWKGAEMLLRRGGYSDGRNTTQMNILIGTLAEFLFRLVERDANLRIEARKIIELISQSGDTSLTSRWLGMHQVVHGVSELYTTTPSVWILDRGQTLDLGRKVMQKWRSDLMARRLIDKLWDLSVPEILIANNMWCDDCRIAYLEQLRDVDSLRTFLKIVFGPSSKRDDARTRLLLDWGQFLSYRSDLEILAAAGDPDSPHLMMLAVEYAEDIFSRVPNRQAAVNKV